MTTTPTVVSASQTTQSQNVIPVATASQSLQQPSQSTVPHETSHAAVASTSSVIQQPQNTIEAPPAQQPGDVAWIKIHEFVTMDEFEAFLEAEGNIWSYRDDKITRNGKKTIYRCNLVKRRGPQCAAGIYTISKSSPDDKKVQLFQKTSPHNHDNIQNVRYHLSAYAKDKIIQLSEHRNTPGAIMFVLSRDEHIQHLSLNQVKNTIAKYKREKFGKTNITLDDLQNFVENQLNVPEDDDKSFVKIFERSPDTDDYDGEEWFRYFVTTKRLLKLAIEAKNLHADSTYKICIQGYPLMVVGTTDMGGHFHLIRLMLSTNETTDDFSTMFKAVNDGVTKIFQKEIKPEALITDASGAIQNAFRNTFGNDPTIIMCWFHVMLNFNKRKLNNHANRDAMREDLRKLKLSYSEDVFNVGSRLFLEKWKASEKDFAENFEATYIKRNRNWFDGAGNKTP